MNTDRVTDTGDTPRPETPFTLRVPAEPAVLAPLRAVLAAWFRRLRWPDEERVAILHAVNEACTNVIEHAYPFDGAGELHLTGREHADGLRRHVAITVQDHGQWQAADTRTETFGLTLMQALMHRVNVHTRPDGTELSLISCAVPQAITGPSHPVATANPMPRRDRLALATDRAELVAQHATARAARARVLIDSSHRLIAYVRGTAT